MGATHDPLEGNGFDGLRELWFEWLAVWTLREGKIERLEFRVDRDTARAAFES